MNLTKVKAIIEALVFASSVPVSLKDLAEILQLHEHTVKQLIYDLIAEYKDGQRGIRIKEIAGGYQFVTDAECADYVESKKGATPQPPVASGFGDSSHHCLQTTDHTGGD